MCRAHNRVVTRVIGLSAFVAVAVILCSRALAANHGTLTGRIVFTASDAPFAGDVTLARADGTLVDLSRSPAMDTAPVVSPDGRRVAFFSTRGGHGAEYVVSIDGSNLRRVTPPVAAPPSVAWSPSGSQLAVLTGTGQGHGALHLASANGGMWKMLARAGQPSVLVGWSPDGTRIAYVSQLGSVEVVSPGGRKVLDLVGEGGSWSPSGRLAVARTSTTDDVYDVSGKPVATLAAVSAAWSPGDLLATMTPRGVLQVRSHGVGRPIVSVRFPHAASPRWISTTVVQLQAPNGVIGYDVRHQRTINLPAAYGPLSSAVPARGVAWGEAPFGTLVVSHLGGTTRAVTSVTACQGRNTDAFEYLQALPDGSGAVYVGDCASPDDVFAMSPDGSGLTRLTQTPEHEAYVAVSPDGARLAFTRAPSAECVGCDEEIWIENADGSDPVEIPLSGPTDGIRQDEDPSFSPDGSSIVFSRWNSSVGDQARLYRVAASGGAATTLGITGGYPAWGPSRIAFLGAAGVETVAPNGSGATPVAGLARADEGPVAWSSTGQLAVLRKSPSLAIVFPSSGRRIPLPGLHMPIELGGGLVWSPDGSKLAFVAADADGAGDVWTVNANGTGLTRLTHDLDAAGTLSWR
jgi:Tol biopolymer transport system component